MLAQSRVRSCCRCCCCARKRNRTLLLAWRTVHLSVKVNTLVCLPDLRRRVFRTGRRILVARRSGRETRRRGRIIAPTGLCRAGWAVDGRGRTIRRRCRRVGLTTASAAKLGARRTIGGRCGRVCRGRRTVVRRGWGVVWRGRSGSVGGRGRAVAGRSWGVAR